MRKWNPRHTPPPTIIYRLRNPLDRNRIFYIGRTTRTLKQRLCQHMRSPHSQGLFEIMFQIVLSGLEPIIEPIETLQGYLQPILRERYWAEHYNKRKYKLLNGKIRKRKPTDRVKW